MTQQTPQTSPVPPEETPTTQTPEGWPFNPVTGEVLTPDGWQRPPVPSAVFTSFGNWAVNTALLRRS
jgi:hypothetical protein